MLDSIEFNNTTGVNAEATIGGFFVVLAPMLAFCCCFLGRYEIPGQVSFSRGQNELFDHLLVRVGQEGDVEDQTESKGYEPPPY